MTTEAPVKPEEKNEIKKDKTPDSKATEKKPDTGAKAAEKKEPAKPANAKDKAKTPATPKKPKTGAGGGGKIIASLALVTSLVAIGGAYWLWQQLDIALDYTQQVSDELKTSMEATRSSIENNNRMQTEQLSGDFKALTQRQEGIETQLGNLLSRIGNTTRDWNLSEAAYLMEIANHKLQLQQDIKTAITALKLADERIRATGEPALLAVREIISKEVTSLENFQATDTVGASLKLSALSDEIEKMPLRVRVKALDTKTANIDVGADTSNEFVNLPTAIWNSLKGLITVRYNERPVEALLTPTQVSNLTENLQIKLEQARLAIIKEQPELFANNIDKSIEWLKAYYNVENEMVANAITQLQSLRSINLKPELPDISGSLRKLKTVAKRIEVNISDKKEGGA